MINFYELEKKCKKNRLKSIFKIISIFIVVFILLFIMLFLFRKYTHQNNKAKGFQKPIVKQKVEAVKEQSKIIEEKKAVVSKKIVKEEVKKSKIPEITYMLNLNSINVKEDKKEDKNLVVKKQSINKKKEKTESKNIEKVRLTTTSLTLQTVLAKIKKYYENGDYDDAINWCKIGSKINNKNDDIWSYYALSLYKRGEKEKAIKVLKTYLKYRKSQKIEKIIKRLK